MSPLLAVDSISALVGAARRMVAELDADALLPRLLGVLNRMLPADRDLLLDVLEHDVVARTLVTDDNVWSRFALHPNPFAHLYHRADAVPPARSLPYEECVRSARVGARMAMTLPPKPAGWVPAEDTRAACARLPPDQRAFVVAMSTKIRDRLRSRPAT